MIGRFREVHSILYFTGLFLMIVSLPLSRFSLSVAQFILVGNWLLETDFRRKWNEFRKNPPALVIVSLFLLHVIGLIHSSDMTYAMKDLRIKLPLLALPVIFSTTKPLESKKFNILLVSYIGAVIISTLINLDPAVYRSKRCYTDFSLYLTYPAEPERLFCHLPFGLLCF